MAERARIDAQNPWPWLDPFTEEASAYFNGRGDDIAELLRAVLAAPACVLFGKSGLGKTSLLLAGLFPQLRQRQLLPVLVRIAPATGHLSAQLLRALAEALRAAGEAWHGDVLAGLPDDEVAGLWEALHDRQRRLVDARGRRWRIAFVLDQFEEVFTLESDEARRRHLFEELGDLIQNRVPPAVVQRLRGRDELLDRIDLDAQDYRVLLSLREDFLPELESWSDLIPRLGTNRVRLLPMSQEQALQAVERTGGALIDHEGALRIVDFLGRQASSGAPGTRRPARHIEPALLSLVCSSLNAERLLASVPAQQLDTSDLESRGTRILETFYDGALAALPDAVRDPAARWIESELITPDGTRRPYPVDALAPALAAALRTLVARRLLRIETGEHGDQVELVHDRLALVAAERALATRQRSAALERMQREKDAAERAAARRQRWLAAVLFVIAGVAMGAAWWAYRESGAAEEARDKAEQAAQNAAEKAVRLEQALQAARDALASAKLAAADAERNFDALLRTMGETSDPKALEALAQGLAAVAEGLDARQAERASQSLHNAMTMTNDASARVALDRALAAVPGNDPVPGPLDRPDPARDAKAPSAAGLLSDAEHAFQRASQDAPVQACPPGKRRVVPHIASRDAQPLLEVAIRSLRAAGFEVRAEEVVPTDRMPRQTDLRYFRRGEQSGADAAAAALAPAGLGRLVPKYVAGYEDSTTLRRCQYELWLVAPATGPPS